MPARCGTDGRRRSKHYGSTPKTLALASSHATVLHQSLGNSQSEPRKVHLIPLTLALSQPGEGTENSKLAHSLLRGGRRNRRRDFLLSNGLVFRLRIPHRP
jgi:hypothetical protein